MAWRRAAVLLRKIFIGVVTWMVALCLNYLLILLVYLLSRGLAETQPAVDHLLELAEVGLFCLTVTGCGIHEVVVFYRLIKHDLDT